MRLAVPLLLFFTLPCSTISVFAAGPQKPASTQIAQTKDTELPIRKVVLYKNGVGYFEHAGKVLGTERLSFDFTTDQLNDVLQSLTALDSKGGHISAVNYNSTSPIEQQLKSLSLGLEESPATLAVYQSIRGQRVEVTGNGATITGRVINVDTRTQKDKDGQTFEEHNFLILATDSGALRTIPLTDSVSVRLLDPLLQREFARYLGIVASGRNQDIRHLTIEDRGEGERQLQVSYISQTPVWKSTYRIVLPEATEAKAILQGWAIVDNTVGADWNNVQLSLVAGSPQSFIQQVSTPFYLHRPEIGLPSSVMTTPQTHESDLTIDQDKAAQAAPPPPPPPSARRAKIQTRSYAVAGTSSEGVIGGIFGGMGTGTGSGGGVYRPTDAFKENDVQTKAYDDFFEYSVQQPVTIHKNESAMVPILQANIPAESVTLYSPKEQHPLRALWITNNSSYTLDRGAFSIYESGAFAGQGLLDPVHPGEKRLLSYAADDAIRVTPENLNSGRQITHVTMAKGILKQTAIQIYERNYQVTNPTNTARTVLIEHPRHAGFECDSDPKPVETTAELYRLRVTAPPKETVRLHVKERRTEFVTYTILNEGDNDPVGLLLRSIGNDPETNNRLSPILSQRQVLADIDQKRKDLDNKIDSLKNEEQRNRENIAALKGDSGAARRFVEQLNRSEDELQSLRQQKEQLDEQRKSAYLKLEQLIVTLNLDKDLPHSTN